MLLLIVIIWFTYRLTREAFNYGKGTALESSRGFWFLLLQACVWTGLIAAFKQMEMNPQSRVGEYFMSAIPGSLLMIVISMIPAGIGWLIGRMQQKRLKKQ